jgi:hypothetical protein
MKHGNGIKDQDDKSRGIESLMTEVFAKVNATDPLMLAKEHEENEIDPIPPVLR